jgi:hypothetical protein
MMVKFSRHWALVGLIITLTGCAPKGSSSLSEEQVLRSRYGQKKLYLWTMPIRSQHDGIERSCWYYREAPPYLGLSDKDALLQSESLNTQAILEAHIQTQLQRILKEKLASAGLEVVPCGLATVSVGAAIASGGASALAFGISSAWMFNNCV